jgi:hypothetical protein
MILPIKPSDVNRKTHRDDFAAEAWERMTFGGLKIRGRVTQVMRPACSYEPYAFIDEWTYQWTLFVGAEAA